MAASRFTGSFIQQEPIYGQGVAAALAIRHRYNRTRDEVSALDRNFAAWQGVLALAPGGQALQVLKAPGAPPAEFSGMCLPLAFIRICNTIAEFLLAESDRPALTRAP